MPFPPVSYYLVPDMRLTTLLSNAHSLHCSLNVTSQPYKITEEMTHFSVVVFTFHCSEWVMMSVLFQWWIKVLIFIPLRFAGRRIFSGTLQRNVYEGRNPNAVLFNHFSFQQSVRSLLHPMYFRYKFNFFGFLPYGGRNREHRKM